MKDAPINYFEIVDRDELRTLSARSNAKGLAHLAGHLALIFATGWIVYLTRGSLLIWPAMMVHGIDIVFLFTTLHECVHRTPFKSRWLNDAVAWGCGLALNVLPDWFSAFHFAHHRNTHIEGEDPELKGKKVDTWPSYLLYLSGWPHWVYQLKVLCINAVGKNNDAFIPPKLKARIQREAQVFIVTYILIALASLLTGSAAALIYWVVPSLLAQPFLRAYLLAEHTGCEKVRDMFENTRTTFTWAPVRFIAWNMPFHTEHHAWPGVPFHALPKLHGQIKTRLVNTADGYTAFHRKYVKTL
ncbi:MAG: fatty acid desaturase [Hyphomicrobiales bacterium]